MKTVNTICLCLVFSLLCGVSAHAADRYMRPSNPGTSSPYTTWATAATNFSQLMAVWQDTDVVWLTNGHYRNNYTLVLIDKDVTIKTAGTRDGTIVDGAAWWLFDIQHSNAVVQGITITNCLNINGGGAVRIYAGGTLKDCTLVGNSADNNRGGAISLEFGGVVDGCLVVSNQASNGGGISCNYGGLVMNSTVAVNRASGVGGGIELHYGGTVSNCVVGGNSVGTVSSGSGGGGISTYYGGEIYNSIIISNSAARDYYTCMGGGVALAYHGIMSNCTIVGNVIPQIGAGVSIDQCSSGGVFNCTISNNVAGSSQARGGGVWCSTAGTIANCEIVNNIASNSGGGVYGDALACVVSNSTIRGNYAQWQGGGVCAPGILRDSVLASNTASYGGGVSSSSGGKISGCEFRGNNAFGTGSSDGGGGIYGVGMIYVTNCLLVNNTATRHGGGIFAQEGGRFYYCTIVGNMASNAGGFYRVVGVQRPSLGNSILFHNTASTVNSNFALVGASYPTNDFCSYTCTAPALTGTDLTGNRYEDPRLRDFAGGDYELGTNSPCIDTGSAVVTAVDLKRVRRPLDGNGDGTNTYDMGAYEFAGRYSDSDGDGMNDQAEARVGTDPLSQNTDGDTADDNYEYVTGTDPRGFTPVNELFNTKLGPAVAGQIIVNWDSVTGRYYSVLSATNLLATLPWNGTSVTNVAGTGGTMSYTNQATGGSEFLTLQVDLPE